jgi:hypothetical protein
VTVQVPATQAATPFGSDGHAVQAGPHADALSSRSQALLQAWVPEEQTKPHWLPSQVACEAPVGSGHGVHDGPQPVTSVEARQKPLHEWVPVGQLPEQTVP